jgi:hypothetical protein
MDYVCSCHILICQMVQTFFNARSTIISVTPNSSSDRKEQDKEQEKTLTTVPATTNFQEILRINTKPISNFQQFKLPHCCSTSKCEPGTFDVSRTSSPLSAAKLSYWDSPHTLIMPPTVEHKATLRPLY